MWPAASSRLTCRVPGSTGNSSRPWSKRNPAFCHGFRAPSPLHSTRRGRGSPRPRTCSFRPWWAAKWWGGPAWTRAPSTSSPSPWRIPTTTHPKWVIEKTPFWINQINSQSRFIHFLSQIPEVQIYEVAAVAPARPRSRALTIANGHAANASMHLSIRNQVQKKEIKIPTVFK